MAAELGTPGGQAAAKRRSTFWMLLVGYVVYYLCRANIGVAAPLLEREHVLTKPEIGAMLGTATLVYAVGKLVSGPAGDLIGGRILFVAGLAASAVLNALFGLGTAALFLVVVWSANRFAQSAGWVSMVQLVSRWYERREHGRIMATLSLSFLVGDALAQGFGGAVLAAGFGWRWLFFFPAGIGLAVSAFARGKLYVPGEADAPRGVDEVPEHDAATGGGLREIARTLVKSRGFWLSAVLAILLTFLRAVFVDWTALFLVEIGQSAPAAAFESAVFPLAGAGGALFAGWYSDRVSGGRRAPVAAGMLGLLVVVLVTLGALGPRHPGIAVGCIAAAGFLLLGPFSLLGGVYALAFGGRRAAATAAGLLDGMGYLGGSVSGFLVGGLAQAHGWGTAFGTLAGASALSLGVVLLIYVMAEAPAAPEPAGTLDQA